MLKYIEKSDLTKCNVAPLLHAYAQICLKCDDVFEIWKNI